jgi:signal transduction histidine kinase
VSVEYLGVVAEQAERITAIIRQLMDFARPREPKISAVDLRTIARSIVKLLEPMARKRNVSLAVTSHDSIQALGDAMQLEQVLSNLVVNAIQACKEGGRVAVSFGIEGTNHRTNGPSAGSSRAYLRVADEGHGMDEATRCRIFEPFFTTKGVGQGTGLGLSVVHGIVEEHGGSISVASEPGRGSTFSVVLPTVHG